MNIKPILVALLALCVTADGAASSPAAGRETRGGKLTAEQAAEVMGFEVGRWEGSVRIQFPGIAAIDANMTRDYRWKEKGKSIEGTVVTTSKEGGAEVSVNHEEFDEKKGVIVVRTCQGLKPESISQRLYDPATRTLHDTVVGSTPEIPPGLEIITRTRFTDADTISFKTEMTVDGVADGKPLMWIKGDVKRLTAVGADKPGPLPKKTPARRPRTSKEVMQLFAGSWSSETTSIPGGNATEPETTRSIITRRWSPEESFVVEQSVPDTGLWVLTHDPDKKNYRSVFVTPTFSNNLNGSWDDAKQVMMWRGHGDDRSTLSGQHRVIDNDHHEWVMKVMRDGQLLVVVHGKLTRRPDPEK